MKTSRGSISRSSQSTQDLTREKIGSLLLLLAMMILVVVTMIVMLSSTMLLQLVLNEASDDGAAKRAQEAVVQFVACKAARKTAGEGTAKAALAFASVELILCGRFSRAVIADN